MPRLHELAVEVGLHAVAREVLKQRAAAVLAHVGAETCVCGVEAHGHRGHVLPLVLGVSGALRVCHGHDHSSPGMTDRTILLAASSTDVPPMLGLKSLLTWREPSLTSTHTLL